MNDDSDVQPVLLRIENLLQSLLRLEIARTIASNAIDETDRQVFELTGVKKRDEICRDLKLSPNTLTEIRNKLVRQGLLVRVGRSFVKPVEWTDGST